MNITKLTTAKEKIYGSFDNSIFSKCFDKTYDSTSYDIRDKIVDEIWTPIQEIQRTTLNNLQNEIN